MCGSCLLAVYKLAHDEEASIRQRAAEGLPACLEWDADMVAIRGAMAFLERLKFNVLPTQECAICSGSGRVVGGVVADGRFVPEGGCGGCLGRGVVLKPE